MTIKQYIHGDGTDYQLWGNIGRFLVDTEIQDKMGGCISSRHGDVWWVSLSHNSKTMGFASARQMNGGHLHLRYFYSDEKNGMGLGDETMITKGINYAKATGCNLIYTNWRKDSNVLTKLGFKSIQRARGNFCRWELTLGSQP